MAHDGIGPGLPGSVLLGGRAGFVGVNPFPIIGARIHPPLLRADTLTRDRLNAWLDEAATGRVALVVAEAGFGKTTLLGDWARNSQRLTAWYRLDPDDRDWLTFCRHLVASGRELDPEFAPDTLRPAPAPWARRSDPSRHRGQPRARIRRVRREPAAGTDADLRRLPRGRRQRRGRPDRPRADRPHRPGLQHRDRGPIDAPAAARQAACPRRRLAASAARPCASTSPRRIACSATPTACRSTPTSWTSSSSAPKAGRRS